MMKVSIMTPIDLRTIDALWVEFNTLDGNMIIQPGHAQTLVCLRAEQEIIICDAEQLQEVIVPEYDGFAYIARKSVTILFSHAISR